MRRWPIGLVLWLLLLTAAEAVLFVIIWRFFVRTDHGQLLDTVALTGNRIGRTHISGVVDTVLNTMTVVSITAATAAVGFIALARRRIAVAFGVILLIAGSNATAQALKMLISRPNLGVDVQRAAAGNSLPSGHTTVAASVVVALLLVLPHRVRGFGAILGAVLASVIGVATLSAGWHRPSDAIAGLLVVGAWAGIAGVFIVIAQRRHGGVDYGPANRWAVALLTLAGIGLLAGAAIALKLTDQVLATPAEELSRRRLFAAYAGGAMGISGTAALVISSVLVTAHRVVPRVVPPELPSEEDTVALAA